MLDQSGKARETSAVSRVANLFPNADPRIVSALASQADALRRYIAQVNQLTWAEVDELLNAFLPEGFGDSTLRATG